MKMCKNPDCVAAQEGRIFAADDQICPRCRQPLVEVDAAGNTIGGPAVARTPAVAGIQWLVAVGTLLLVLGGAFVCGTVLNSLRVPTGAVATATTGAVAPANATATAEAALVLLTSTPIVLPTEQTGGSAEAANPPTATPVAGAGTNSTGNVVPATVGSQPPTAVAQTNSGASPYVIPGVSEVRLCGRLAASEPCAPVTTYNTTAAFNVAVRAGFGPGGATTALARLYGPDGTLLHTTDPLTPNRTGTYWIGFTFAQSQPWVPGNYQAEIDLDGINMRQVTIPVVP